MKQLQKHFSRVASRYRDLRTTDPEPILYIINHIQHLPQIKAADFGCGTGRYPIKFFQYLGDRLFLYCIDCNKEMLHQLHRYLTRHGIRNFRILHNHAEDNVLENGSLDCVFTFNAIHHFRIEEFFRQVARVLKNGGVLFVYTRFRSQNRRNIWGRFFPLFTEKETRLYELDELKTILTRFPELELHKLKYFRFTRVATLDWLVKQARNHHYSTFYLYDKDEFAAALRQFRRNLQNHFEDMQRIQWQDENVLLMIGKRVWN